jgi:hypothetical protein
MPVKKKTPTQKYVEKTVDIAIEEAVKGTSISNCNINVDVKLDESFSMLASAAEEQAAANNTLSCAIRNMASVLSTQNITGIKIEG